MKKSFTTLLILLSIAAFAQSKNEVLRKSKSAKSNTAPKYEFNLCDSSIYFLFDTSSKVFVYNNWILYEYNVLNKTEKRSQWDVQTGIWTFDSIYYNMNSKIDRIVTEYWNNGSFSLGDKISYYYDSFDSIKKKSTIKRDTTGGLSIVCPQTFSIYKYDSKNRLSEMVDSTTLNAVLSPCNYSFYIKDSSVYYSNGLLADLFHLGKNMSGYTHLHFIYNSDQTISEIITMSFSSLNSIDTINKHKYIYANQKIKIEEYIYDYNNYFWISTPNYTTYFDKDRFGNIVSKKTIYQLDSDSTHYYYHIPSCLSYYTTKYDTIANTFNLTIDSASIAQAVGYSWDFGDGTTSNLQFPSHHFAFDTTYNVCLKIYKSNGDSCTYCHLIGKDYQGHIIKSAGFNLNVKGNGNIGINESSNSKNEIIIYPNPASQSIVISNKSLVNTIEITNVLGQIVLAVAPSPLERAGVRSINIETLPNGIYFLKATDEKGNVMNTKFIKQ